MQAHGVNSLLGKLVALTHERDEATLEIALIKTLTDYIAMVHDDKTKSAIIYHLTDAKKQLLSVLTVHENKLEVTLPALLKQTIINCFTWGEISTYQNDDVTNTKLYPLKNAAGQTTSVIGIEAPVVAANAADTQLDVAIGMLLQIYQNFTELINDNECDTLTGLLNRKTFEYKINKTLTQMQSSAKRKADNPTQFYFLAIFDIDHFKRVNDEFGHLIGDEVLLLFSQLMRQSFRETDPLFRFGGEEFVGVFECSNPDDIKKILERFRQKVESFSFPQVGKVTVSSGFTEILDFDTSSQLIDRADSALYFAKNNGRNQIAFYEQLIVEGLLEETRKEGDIEFF